jgi:hypothetical protein
MLGCQKYKLDRPLTQALAELPHQWGLLANAFVNNNPFYAEHEWTRGSLQRRSVVHCTTLAVVLHRCFRRYDTASLAAFTGRAPMFQDDTGLAQVVRGLHWGAPSVHISDDGCNFLAAAP